MSALLHRDEVLEQIEHRWGPEFDEIVGRLEMSPEAIAKIMTDAVPRKHFYDEFLGPFYDTEGVCLLLNKISRQAVHERVKNGTLLQVTSSDKVALYPIFQFSGREVDPNFKRVLSEFRNVTVGGWAVATWFRTPAQELAGDTPMDVIKRIGQAPPIGRASKKSRNKVPAIADVLAYAANTVQRWEAP